MLTTVRCQVPKHATLHGWLQKRAWLPARVQGLGTSIDSRVGCEAFRCVRYDRKQNKPEFRVGAEPHAATRIVGSRQGVCRIALVQRQVLVIIAFARKPSKH